MPSDQPGPAPSIRVWCRDVIEHHCIYRSPPGQLELISGEQGRAAWQFYFPIALFDAEFAERVAVLFWERYADRYRKRPFQLAACESGGMPLACAIQHVAALPINIIESKKRAKSYGMRNWLEGVILPGVPVLMIDDVVGGGRTMRAHVRRLRSFGIEVVGVFALASCKHAPPLTIDDLPVEVIYGPQEFTRSYAKYVVRYKREPQFQALI